MNKEQKIMSLLSEADKLSSSDDKLSSSVRPHIKNAIQNLSRFIDRKKNLKQNNQSNYQKWWGNLVAGGKQSAETNAKSLEWINRMIAIEQEKLNDLENKSQSSEEDDVILD